MNIFTLECSHCKVALDVEDGLDTFYCKYCGAKLIVEGMSVDSLNAKVRLRNGARRVASGRGIRVQALQNAS